MIAAYYIQKDLYSLLTADSTLMALLTGIYDDPPENTDYPYITLGDLQEYRDDTFGRISRRVVSQVDVWSDYKGAKELLDIVGQLTTTIDGVAMTLTGSGWTHIRTVFDSVVVSRVDGVVRHATVTLTVYAHRTT